MQHKRKIAMSNAFFKGVNHACNKISEVLCWTFETGLKEFLEIERGFDDVSDEQHIFNKALFDATKEAIRLLSPPYRSRLTGPQARVKRQTPGTKEWAQTMFAEVEKQVLEWSHPDQPNLDEEEAVRMALIQDIYQVSPLDTKFMMIRLNNYSLQRSSMMHYSQTFGNNWTASK